MIPIRHSSLFKSRWVALLWAAGIIWFAVDFAGPDQGASNNSTATVQDVTGATVSKDDLKQFADFAGATK
ncbi:MAG: hypothetical protein ABIO69_00730 [Sphingomicrobium sp.]